MQCCDSSYGCVKNIGLFLHSRRWKSNVKEFFLSAKSIRNESTLELLADGFVVFIYVLNVL